MLKKVLSISTISAAVLLVIIFQTTTPASIHPLGILLVFILLYVLVLGVLTFFVYHILYFGARLKQGEGSGISFRRTYLLSSVLALAPVILLGIQSVGNLTAYEVFLIVVFEFFACFYVMKRR